MGHVVYGNVQQVDGYNGAENSQASPQEDPVEPLGLCPLGTVGRWLCGRQFCARGNWPEDEVCPGCDMPKGTLGGGGGGGRGAALYRVHRGGHRGGGGGHQEGVSPNYRGRNPRVVTQRGQGAPRARGPHSSAPQPRGSLNAGTRGTGGPRGGAWRGRAPRRGWSTRGSRGRGGRGRGSEPQDPCTQ